MKIGGKYLELPLIQGGMGIGISLSGLAGAVAKCGGMGVISSVNAGYRESDFDRAPREANMRALKAEIERARKLSEGRGLIGVNIMTALTDYEDACRIAVEAGADAIISGAGLPMKLPSFTKGTDVLCIPIVSSGRAARLLGESYMKKYQVLPDMYVLEGHLAGGHLGFSGEALADDTAEENDDILTDVLRETHKLEEKYGKHIPVCVAGGVYDGQDMAHFLKAGAEAVQIGTRFIATEECDAADGFKEAILRAANEDIVITKSPVGMPARAIMSPLLKRLKNGECFPAIRCCNCLTACKKNDSISYCISRALIEAVKGNWQDGLFFTGSNGARVDRILPVRELIREIMSGYEASINKEASVRV